MNNQHKIEHVTDVLRLTEEEFDRFLPDFCAWFISSKQTMDFGAEPVNMTWFDDGLSGQVHSITLMVKGTDKQVVIPGPAYREGE